MFSAATYSRAHREKSIEGGSVPTLKETMDQLLGNDDVQALEKSNLNRS
jgi:hypothetical protein